MSSRSDLAAIAKAGRQLQSVVLRGPQVLTSDLETVAELAPCLIQWHVYNAPDVAVIPVGAMAAARHFVVQNCAPSLRLTGSSTSLTSLHIEGFAGNGVAVATVVDACAALEALTYARGVIGDGFFVGAKGLKELRLWYLDATGESAWHGIEGLEAERIEVYACRLWGSSVERLAACRNLTAVTLSRCEIGDLASLGRASRLQRLDLSASTLQDDALASLSRLESLKVLVLGGTRVSGAAVRGFQAARPDIEVSLGSGCSGEEKEARWR